MGYFLVPYSPFPEFLEITEICKKKKYSFLGLFFRATPAAHRGSQARGLNQSYSCQPQPPKHQIQTTSANYTAAHSNTRSLTHWARPGIEPVTSWFLVGFVFTVPWWELQSFPFWKWCLPVKVTSNALFWMKSMLSINQNYTSIVLKYRSP